MKVTFDVDLEKLRRSLISDGYTEEEIAEMPDDKIIQILGSRIHWYIERRYNIEKRCELSRK